MKMRIPPIMQTIVNDWIRKFTFAFPAAPRRGVDELSSNSIAVGVMFFKKYRSIVWLALLLTYTVSSAVMGQDWTRWRGENGDGVVTGFTAPVRWPEQIKAKWKTNVGIGHSSPLVVGKRIYLHSRQGDSEVVGAYELDSGKSIWTDKYSAAYQVNPAAVGHGKGPKSTPVIAAGSLYTLGITGVLSCYDAMKGKLKWRKESVAIFSSKAPLYGTGASPIVDRGLVIAAMGGNDQGGIIAFDGASGAEKWRWAGDGPGYATPIVVEIGGKRQLVTQSQGNIIGLWIDNGSLLWKIPFETDYVQNIVTPLLYKDLLIFSGLNKGVFAVRVAWRENQWTTDTVWQTKEVAMYMNSPVLWGSSIFGLSHKNKGQFFCLNADTGKVLWTGDPRQGENAAMLVAGDTIISLTNEANLIISSASDKASAPIRKYNVAQSETWATPVIVGKQILIKDEQTLALYGLE
jgi:outer membrane protein assembly factor BamB